MAWWQRPFVPPLPLMEVWQRQQAGFPRCETLHACDCSVRFGFPSSLLVVTAPFILGMPGNDFGCQKYASFMQIDYPAFRTAPVFARKILFGKMGQHFGNMVSP